MTPPSNTYRENPQTDLLPNERQIGPVLQVLEERLSPAGFAALKRYGQRLESLIEGQQLKDAIREQFFTMRAEGISAKEASRQIMEEYELRYDLFDKIIYPRIRS